MTYKDSKRKRRHRAGGNKPVELSENTRTKKVRLGDLSPGCSGKICNLSCHGSLRRRLMNMGVVHGTPFEISRVAPLGDPIELKFKDFNLSLRKEEAGDIWVEVEEDEF